MKLSARARRRGLDYLHQLSTHDRRLIAQVLKQGAAILADPAAWTQNAAARDSEGRSLDHDPADPRATQYCAVGVLWAARNSPELKPRIASTFSPRRSALGLLNALVPQPRRRRELLHAVARWNNAPDRTADEVAALLDAAADLAKKARFADEA